MTIKVALVGLGYWGPNLARNLVQLNGAELHTLCDLDPERLAYFGRQYPHVQTTSDYDTVLNNLDVNAIVIASPAHTHFELAKLALQANKSVLVEKPLAHTSAHCRDLIELAKDKGLTLMVGHVFVYNAAVHKVKEYIQAGELGQIHYIYSQRLNLGRVRRDVNALWNFAPHDLSILRYWLETDPKRVIASGYSYVQPSIEDVVFMTLEFASGLACNVHISWLDPHKVRRMTIVGSQKMLVYDDVNADARIMLYDKGVVKELKASDSAKANSISLGNYETFDEFQLLVRAGDILIPKLDFTEPLKKECQHFVDCVRTGQRPLTDGYDGLRVVEVLEAAQHSMSQGISVSI